MALYSTKRVQYAESFQKPKYNCNDDDYIENGFYLVVHGYVSIDGPQQNPDENEDNNDVY